MDNTFNIAVFVAVATLIITIVIIALFGSVVFARTYRKAYGQFFALTMLGIILWSLGDLGMLLGRDPGLVHLAAEVFYISPMIIPVFIWFFAISFPENLRPSMADWLAAVCAFSVLTAGFLWKFYFFIRTINITDSLNVPQPQLPGFLFYAMFFSAFFLVTYWTFFQKSRHLRGLNKTQVIYTLYGALIASVPALLTNLSLPVMGFGGVIWLGPFFTLFFAAAVTVAIVRHRLFDIRPVIVRTLVYALTILVVSSLYGFVIFGLAKWLLGLHFSLIVQVGLSVSTGFAALVFQSIKKFFDKYTKQLFYHDAYDAQNFFDEYNKALVSTIELDIMLKETAEVIVKHIKAEYCIVGVKDGSDLGYRIAGTEDRIYSNDDINKLRHITPHIHQSVIVTDDIDVEQATLKDLLTSNDIALLARLTTDFKNSQEGLGYLILGSKKSGNPYTDEDKRAIETVCNELIIALQNALRFEEIERFSETLQEKVDVATLHLQRANRKLKKLNDTKDDFIGMASHQLRTPMTSAKGYISLVLDGDAGKINHEQRKLLEQAFFSTQRMVYLVADLLNVSRLKTGKFTIERINTNLAKVITDELAQLKASAEARDLELTYHAPTHFPLLRLDETKTRQVIMNFLDNAIYYTPSGGHIRVELEELPKSVEFRVIDDGIGVPTADRPHLFTKFYRAKNAQRARPDGTGLGLYMAQKVVTAQGGAIIFNSKEGHGSVFGFSFPKEMPEGMVPLPAHSRS